MPLPNWASLPTIFRSVSTVTRVRSPASYSTAVTVAAALPVPRDSLPLASMTARRWSRSRSTKCTLPLNSLVTGPTLILTLPRTSSPPCPVICAPGIKGITCSRSMSTSQASSIGALTVNSLAIFIGGFLSSRAVFGECAADQVTVVRCLGQGAQACQGLLAACGHQFSHAECDEGGDPVDGLGDARRLVKVEIPCTADELGGVFDECRGGTGHGAAHDVGSPSRFRVVDPVVEAAPAQGVVQVAAAVG